jgi:alpha-D-xyloside xylohydrolase
LRHEPVRTACILAATSIYMTTAPANETSQPGAVTESKWAELRQEQQADHTTITSVAPGVWKLHVGSPEAQTPMRFQPFAPRTKAMEELPAASTFPVNLRDVSTQIRASGSTIEIPMLSDERIYGFGMSFREFEYGDRLKALYSHDGYTLGPAPFYVSSRGYGIYVDTARYARFYCGNIDRKGDAVPPPSKNTAADRPGLTTAALYQAPKPTRRSMTIEIPTAQGVDLYLIAGPAIGDVVRRYNLFSGGGTLPPMWGLGIWYRMGPVNEQEATALAAEFRQDQLPITVVGLEPNWQKQVYSCSYQWNTDAFPDPERFIRKLGDDHLMPNLWLQGFVHPSSPIYAKLFPYSGNTLVWKGLVPDFSLPEAREIWGDYLNENFIKKGVSGFKVDECESQYLDAQPFTFSENSSFPSGMDGEQMHSLFGRFMQDVLYRQFRENNRRTYSLIRNSAGLAAPLPFALYSDSYSPPEYARAMAGAALSGQLFVPEVRDAKSVDEFLRRIELAIFSPMVLMNAWQVKMPYWDQIDIGLNDKGQRMPESEQVKAACRELFNLRMTLIPYLYSAFEDYRATGTPPFRPLVMDWPEDSAVYTLVDEFMVGPSLLVAPIFPGTDGRDVYLPIGIWYDFWTNQKLVGGKSYPIRKPVGQIPVFVRDNSLLPLAKPVQWIDEKVPFEITVRVYGDQPHPFTLIEDDGTSFDYEKGAQNKVTLTWTPARPGETHRMGSFPDKRYEIVGWDKQEPKP